jgi:hypothetical protein
MGAAASTVFAAAVETPPPFDEHTHEGRLLLEHKKLSAQTLNSVAAYIYFSGVHTLVLAGLLLSCIVWNISLSHSECYVIAVHSRHRHNSYIMFQE